MRRAQIKLFESIAVMVVFAFLVVFGVNFYFTIEKASLGRDIQRANQLEVFGSALKTGFLPELDCASLGIQESACIDMSKLAAFKVTRAANIPANTQLYFPVFGWSIVNVSQIYPVETTPPDRVLYSNPLPPGQWNDKSVAQVPMLLFYPETNSYALGQVEVSTYAK
ncbi:MAG: hypothetical protein AABY13_00780 [Nanoarchaeota archaeon]